MATEQDIIRDAIIGTEKEIFAAAFGKEDLTLDESGDRGPEQMGEGLEGQVEPDDEDDGETEAETDEVKAEDEPKEDDKPKEPPKAEEPKGRVPAGRLREESEARRAAEAERERLKVQLTDAEAARKRDIEALNARLEELRAAVAKPQAPVQPNPTQQTQVQRPDLFEDPQGFVAYIERQNEARIEALRGQMEAQRVEGSLSVAHQKHGEAFISAFDAVKKLDPQNPENRSLVQRMYRSPNPGEELVRWHKRNEALREFGDDPNAYKARVQEEARKALMADPEFQRQVVESLRESATMGDAGKPRTVTRLPASLNRASGSNARSPNNNEIADGSDAAIFNSAWK